MIERVFAGSGLWLLLGVTLVAFVLGLIVGLVKGQGKRALYRSLEAGLLAFAGGLLARLFASVLMGIGHDSTGTGLAVGWGFFLWPGAIDTVATLAGQPVVTRPDILLTIAAMVGAFTGMMDGIWRIHNWKGLGWLSFPLDVTWGLAGITNACLLHLVNFAWGDHKDEPRTCAHRYAKGFGMKPGYAFTQGSVMSNLSHGPTDSLYSHERTHVWQNRIFGPFYTLSYLGWMAVWLVPGLIAGAVVGAGPLQGAEKWCYFNNPWEVWGYSVQKQPRPDLAATPAQKRLIWPGGFVIAWSVPFFAVVLLVSGLVASKVW